MTQRLSPGQFPSTRNDQQRVKRIALMNDNRICPYPQTFFLFLISFVFPLRPWHFNRGGMYQNVVSGFELLNAGAGRLIHSLGVGKYNVARKKGVLLSKSKATHHAFSIFKAH